MNDVDRRLEQVLARLGDGGEITIRIPVYTGSGERVLVTWRRAGEARERAEFALSLDNALRRIEWVEDEFDQGLEQRRAGDDR